MQPKYRSVIAVILLSMITCGIYFFYWMYAITEETNAYLGINDTSGGEVVLFSIITCGIYAIFWYYKMGGKIDLCQQRAGIMPSNDAVILLLLSIFGLSIVSAAIIQSNLNKVWYPNN